MKTFKGFVLTLAALGAASCVDLEQEPAGGLVKSGYYETEADAIAAVSGVYSSLSGRRDGVLPTYGYTIFYLNDLAGDYLKCGAHANSPETKAIGASDYTATNTEVSDTWKKLYIGVNRANSALEHIPEVDAPEAVKERLIREVKFIRAIIYFNAVQLFGEVPLLLTEADAVDEEKLFTRVEVPTVYRQIIADLEEAEALPVAYTDPSDAGRATSGAASALLARVYLVRATNDLAAETDDFNRAAEYARKVIGSGSYRLVEKYYDIFDPNPDKKNGPEHIFSVQYTTDQHGAGNAGNVISHCPFSSTFNNDPLPVIHLSDPKFYDLFSDADQRKDASWAKYLYNPETDSVFVFEVPRLRKFIDTLHNVNQSPFGAAAVNVPVLRLAETYLILAEAVNEAGGPTPEAYDALNRVRRRAFRQNLDAPSAAYDVPASLSREDFRQRVRDEYFFEFVEEQRRWYDLVRWKTLVKAYVGIDGKGIDGKGTVNKRNYRYPIPQSERNQNPSLLWQNWGYDGADPVHTGADPYASYE